MTRIMRVRPPATCRCPRRRNILPHIESSYLKSCLYNVETDPECPIFQLKYMVSEAGEDFRDMAVKVRRERLLLRRSDVTAGGNGSNG